jgi:hypothetical protein
MLDFDESVLGIEIYNDYSGKKNWFENPDYEAPAESETGFSLDLWDRILSTGRKCWGFCVPDHSVKQGTNWHGRNILLVSEFTEHQCLQAYRQGQFYGCLKGTGLAVKDFSATASSISIELNALSTIKFITETGLVLKVEADRASYQIPQKEGHPDVMYVRIEVEDPSGERLFLQPVRFK